MALAAIIATISPSAESAIVARICEDFNLTPVLARAHYE
jgi:hypothetical protein